MTVTWTGDEGLLTMGTGPDHSIFDIYIGGSLWQSYDGYTADPGERVIHLPADALLEIRNRATKNIQSTGYVIRFKQLDVVAVTYDERTIQYTYDALSRLTEANYNNGAEILTYGFDLAGNLTNLNGASRTYSAANELVNDGTNNLTYDDNGNMVNDGVNSYVWDRANRLLSMGGISYTYNGDGNRIQQDALRYILDLQPGLAQVIGDSDGNRYIHSLRGIHAMSDGATWTYPVTDALGSVRGYVGANTAVLSNVNYTPIGVPDTNNIGPAFTGEWRTGGTGMQYHRARYLSPGLGVWLSMDPFEGMVQHPMSLNGYAWVEGNVVNSVDPSGLCVAKSLCLRFAPENWRCNCLSLCTPAPTCDELLAFNCTELWASRGCQPFTTPTPSSPPVILFFGGSYGETEGKTANDPGPDPTIQTPVWVLGTTVFPYIGTGGGVTAKQRQADLVSGFNDSNLIAIGYSAGADAALIFANDYGISNIGRGKVTGLALLEGTLTGGMHGGLSLENQWRGILDRLLREGTNIYVLNDDANDSIQWIELKSYIPPSDALGRFCCDARPTQEHWQGGLGGQVGTGTNNSETYKNYVLGWFENPIPCTCSN